MPMFRGHMQEDIEPIVNSVQFSASLVKVCFIL